MDHSHAQRVGTEFVRQYYTLLHKDPLQLHRFYLDQSSFVHASGVETNDEPVVGQKAIYEKIQSLHFVDCRTTIRQTDSQKTVDDAIVVQVCGDVSNNGAPMRPFVQTFILSPESPKKYYVRNDIFRYQDEIWEPIVDSTAQAGGDVIATGIDSVTESVVAVTQDDPPPERTEGEGAETSAGAPADEDDEDDEIIEPAAAPEKTGEPQKPFSWANVAASSKSQPKRANAVNPPPGLSQPVTVPAALPQRERPSTRRQPNPQGGIEKVPNQQPAPVSQQQQQGPTFSSSAPPPTRRHPDSHQIFIGNLDVSLTTETIRAEFEKWGHVIDVRLNPKHFGFVIFNSPDPVQKLLKLVESGTPLMINNTRVNLEEKKVMPNRGGGGGPGNRKDAGPPYQNRSERSGGRFGGRGDGSRR